jgi:hypothetical protein
MSLCDSFINTILSHAGPILHGLDRRGNSGIRKGGFSLFWCSLPNMKCIRAVHAITKTELNRCSWWLAALCMLRTTDMSDISRP